MIIGKFVGKVNISLEIPDNYPGLLPYCEMSKEWKKVAEVLEDLIKNG